MAYSSVNGVYRIGKLLLLSFSTYSEGVMGQYLNYTDEDIIRSCKEVKSCAKLLEKLGLRPCGGNYSTMKRKISELNIDCSHWTCMGWNKGQKLKGWDEYKNNNRLKVHLVNELGKKCEKCGLSHWLDQEITLELHHVDGDRANNILENLELLCPNCHSLTKNWRGRKSDSSHDDLSNVDRIIKPISEKKKIVRVKKEKKPTRDIAKNEIEDLLGRMPLQNVAKALGVSRVILWEKLKLFGIEYAKFSYPKQILRRVERPPYEDLKKELASSNYSAMGRKYGVSDNAIRKWMKIYEKYGE